MSDSSSGDMAARFTRFHDPNDGRTRGSIVAVEIVRGPASQLEQARLQLSDDGEVFRVRRVHHHNGAPFLVEDATMPAREHRIPPRLANYCGSDYQ